MDSSGPYAQCKYEPQRDSGSITVDKTTRDGSTIGGLRDTYPGEEAHWGAVQEYLENGLQHWIYDEPYASQVRCQTNKVLIKVGRNLGCSFMLELYIDYLYYISSLKFRSIVITGLVVYYGVINHCGF